MGKLFSVFILIIAALSFAPIQVKAQSILITSNTNWSTISPSPTSSTTITIKNNATLTIDVNNAVCSGIQVGSNTTPNKGNATLAFNTGAQLIVGTVTLGEGTSITGTLDMTQGGILQIGSSFTLTKYKFTAGIGTLVYNFTSGLSIPPLTYNNLIIKSSTSANYTITSGATINGKFTIMDQAAVIGTSSSMVYGSDGILEYAQSTSYNTFTNPPEWQNSSINGPKTVIINTTGQVTLAATNGRSIKNLILKQGVFALTSALTILDNGSITRSAGSFYSSSTPQFAGSVNLIYDQNSSLITTGKEVPSIANISNLTINNSNGVNFSVSGSRTIQSALNLNSGILTLTSPLSLANGATINRSAGSLASAPTFGSSVNVTYNQHTSSISSGSEMPTDPAVLNNLTISNTNGVSLSAPTYVNGTVAFGSVNNTTLTTNNNLVFHTTATSVGRLADITNNGVNSGNSINGNVTVERYIAGRRAYRQLAAGVNTTGSIRANWQNGGSSDLHNGIHITGSTTGANGFDATGSGAANMFTYTPGSPNYTAIANTDVLTLNALQGYRVFVYGDRGENLSVANTVTSGSTTTNKDFDNAYTVLKATGTLVTGTVTYNSTSSVPLGTATGSYSLIANPYWSPVSFDALSKSGIDATYWVWDPTVGNRGAYISWTTGSGSAGGLTTNIQPGQAIFVRTNGASPSLTFSESNKTSTQSTKGFRLNNTVPGKITVQLFENSRLQNNQQMQDATAVAFDDAFAATIGNEDAAKFANSDENIGIVRDAQLLGVEGRPLADGDIIPLRISRLISNYSYSLKFNGENLPAGTEATLEDLYDNKTYPINVTGTTVVPFSFNSSDNATFYERFRIVMKKGQAAPLPFSFTNLTAIKQGGKIQLDWSVANETGVTSYEVERSADGVNYTVIGTVNTIANNGSSNSYTYTDAAPLSKNSYRIKANLATEVKYSNTVTIAMGGGKGQQQLLVYPNPVAGRGVRVQMNELASGNYVVRLYNPSGQQIYQKQVSHQGGAFSMPLQIPHASVGMYTIEVSGAATQIKERIIVQQ